ncbi:MAG: COX15/CtaA family protein [Bacteroidota bacterium]
MFSQKLLLKINTLTTGSVFVLILIGSVVRSLGAGMGCPDWPKCFGSYVPPTTLMALPDNYLEIFKDQRLRKNERLARTFNRLGFQELAYKITNDPFVLAEQEFDVTKAWIEYINRLVGVLIGFFVFANMVLSFSLRKEDRWVPIAGVAIFILTGFQGWVGSLVVSTNLLHGFITFHMLLALFILSLLIWMNVRIKQLQRFTDKPIFLVCTLLFILCVLQIVLGTEVRGIVDDLIVSSEVRDNWGKYLSVTSFYIHRSYSWLILIGAMVIFYLIKRGGYKRMIPTSLQLLTLVFLAMLAGIGMVLFGFPFWLQPLHLIIATGIFGLLFYLVLRFKISN